MDSQGRILIPRHLRKQAGVEAGAEVLVFVENGGLTILSRDAARAQARRMAAEALKGCRGGSLVGDLVAERRRDARVLDASAVLALFGGIRRYGLEVRDFTREQAGAAARLCPPANRHLSLGDRACLALAANAGLTAFTADTAWRNAKVDGVEVELLR